jgi:hypothetical protein
MIAKGGRRIGAAALQTVTMTARRDPGRQHEKVGLVGEVRRRFHEELRALESEVQRIGVQARLLLEKALQALTHRDVAVCDAVIIGDDEVDELYLDVERRILGLFALQTPVASDLRLLTALLHINLHLERIADQAVNMAKITKLADGLPQSPKVLQPTLTCSCPLEERQSDARHLPPNLVGELGGCRSSSGAGQEAFGDGSDRLVLDLGLEAQQLDRGDLVEPFALHDDVAGLLDAGVMVHGEPQRRRERLLLTGRGQLQGGHDQPREGSSGRQVPGRPPLRVGAGQVEHPDRAMALAHWCAQPCPDARRQRQGSKVGPA